MLATSEDKNKINKRILIKFLESLDINVNTNTKARGHQGFFLKNRIDVSKLLNDERSIEVMVHEFAHYIHSKIENDIHKTGGSLEKLFCYADCKIIENELKKVTQFVDKSSRMLTLMRMKDETWLEIKTHDVIIKKDYPKFQRSKKFCEFDKYIKKSDAKYLLKYDRVKILTPFLKREKIISIANLDSDYDMPRAFSSYIKMKSYQRKQSRISRRINKLNKYYNRPSELFARFVEGYFIDRDSVVKLAPYTTLKFNELMAKGYYFELHKIFDMF